MKVKAPECSDRDFTRCNFPGVGKLLASLHLRQSTVQVWSRYEEHDDDHDSFEEYDDDDEGVEPHLKTVHGSPPPPGQPT